jgi:hypothetical protein
MLGNNAEQIRCDPAAFPSLAAVAPASFTSRTPADLGLFVFGVGQGSLVTLVFNVLVTASPKEFAGDVGSLRGTTNNLAAAVGTAVVSALVVGLLSAGIMRSIADHPLLTPALQSQLDLDSINFVSNDRLLSIMQRTTASPEQVNEALRINTVERLRALKVGLLAMAGVAFLTILAAGRLPDYKPGEIPSETQPSGSLGQALRVLRPVINQQ